MSFMSFDEIEKVVKRQNCDVKYWILGDSDKTLIFFAHGAAVDHAQFDLQMPLLKEDYQIIRWDMRGNGQSRPLKGHFNVKDAVNDIISILDDLGKEEAIFIGQSAGTYVIQELAFQYPKMVKAMIIIDGTCITAKLSIIESISLKISPLIFRIWPYENLKKASINASAIKPPTKQYLKEKFDELSKEEFVKIFDGLSNCIHYEPNYHVKAPLLLVYGEHDKTGNILKSMKQWAKRDKQSKYIVVPDAGHGSNQDNPKFFNKVMMEFLDELKN